MGCRWNRLSEFLCQPCHVDKACYTKKILSAVIFKSTLSYFFCRANFEVATPSDDEAGSDENDNIGGGGVGEAGGGEGGRRSAPKIMDEDEWTEQNFGASSLVNVEGDEDEDGTNTSDDDVR